MEKKKKENKTSIAKEPSVEYQKVSQSTLEKSYDIPTELIITALDSAQRSVKNGNVFTSEQVADFLDREMGWTLCRTIG